MNNFNKNLLFNKFAAPDPATATPTAPEPATATTTIYLPVAPATTRPIESMQEKMQAFAKIIVPSAGSSVESGKGQMVPAEAGLGFFLSRHYSGAGKYRQFEKSEAPKIKDKGSLTSTQNYPEIRNSIENIGGTGKEKKPDGVWGPRTQNGINNILHLSGTLLDFAGKIQFTANKDFSAADQQALAAEIPEAADPAAKIPISKLNDHAEKICPILDKLNSFANALHQHLIGQYEEYKKTGYFSPGEKEDIEAGEEIKLDPIDKNYLNKFSNKTFDVSFANKTFKISFKDLMSYNALVATLKKNKYANDVWILKNYKPLVEEIKKIVKQELYNNLLDENTSEAIEGVKEVIIDLTKIFNQVIKTNPQIDQGQRGKVEQYIKEIRDPATYRDPRKLDLLRINSLRLRDELKRESEKPTAG